MNSNNINHPFYLKPKSEQIQIQISIGLVALILFLIFIGIGYINKSFSFSIILIVITLSIIAPFFDVPSGIKNGNLIYYSSLFLSEKEKKGHVQIHGRTLFDYVFVLNKKLNAKQQTNFVLQKYLEGLLNLIDQHKNTPELVLKGTSFIINKRTANKLGFKIVRTNPLQYAILIFNYFNLLVSNSLVKNKITFPKISKTKTFKSKIGPLLKHKIFIENLNNSLKQ